MVPQFQSLAVAEAVGAAESQAGKHAGNGEERMGAEAAAGSDHWLGGDNDAAVFLQGGEEERIFGGVVVFAEATGQVKGAPCAELASAARKSE